MIREDSGYQIEIRTTSPWTALVLDIEAVVDRLGLDEMSIYSWGSATIPALVYTARHPERVMHLVQTPRRRQLRTFGALRSISCMELAEIDLDLMAEIFTRMLNPDLGDQVIKQIMELGNAAIAPPEAMRFHGRGDQLGCRR